MTKWELDMAFGAVEPRYVKSVRVFYREWPTWRYVMKKSIKFAAAAAAVVLTIGVIALFMALQNRPGIGGPASRPENKPEDGPVTLQVVSEYATDAFHGGSVTSFEFSDILYYIVSDFNQTHDDVQIELTFLPLEETEREITLQKMRTEIMAGKGPDIYLLPAGTVAGEMEGGEYLSTTYLKPLIPDVEQAMRNRLFYDLSEFYNNDKDLKTEELKQEIMDAGVYDGCRYVLPIGWDMPIAAVDKAALEKVGMDESVFSTGLKHIMESALKTGDAATIWASRIFPSRSLCTFPNLFDYDAGRVTLTEEEVMDYAQTLLAAQEASEDFQVKSRSMELFTYLSAQYPEEFALDGETPFRFSDLTYAAELLGMAKCENRDIDIVPVAATDGSVIAEVTYWGAINANCPHAEDAYSFLRTFLGKEVQHQEKYADEWLRLGHSDTAWPVRTVGSVEAKWKADRAASGGDGERRMLVNEITLSDNDLPLLTEKIDQVRFTTSLTFDFGGLIPRDESKTEESVRAFLESAKYHIAES